MALIDDGDGGANWGCYGPSLVPVLPQAPGGAQHPHATALELQRRFFQNCLKTYLFSRSFPWGFRFPVLYAVHSIGLAVLYIGHSK